MAITEERRKDISQQIYAKRGSKLLDTTQQTIILNWLIEHSDPKLSPTEARDCVDGAVELCKEKQNPAVTAPAAEVISAEEYEARLMAGAKELEDKIKYSFRNKVDNVQNIFANIFSDKVMAEYNRVLALSHQRAMDMKELAFIYVVHRQNVLKAKDGHSSFKAIYKYSLKVVRENSGVLKAPIALNFITAAMKAFERRGLTEIIKEPSKGKATCYRMLKNDEIDACFNDAKNS